jgi:ABC-type multidrug transport system fused ATPase/permease subunit
MQTFKKLLALLEPEQRRKGLALLALMLVGMMLETLGVGLVIPVLAIIADPNVGARYPVLQQALDYFGNDRPRLIGTVMATMVGVYAIKALFLAALTWHQARFVFSIESGLSRRLYAGYLRQPYTFHMQRNSALLVRNVTTGVGQFAGALMAATMLASEILVLAGVAGLLLYAEPVGAILVGGALAAAVYSFYWVTKDRILNWGEARQYHEGQRLQRLQQGLGGVREVKMLGREAHFVAEFDLHNAANAGVGKRQVIVTSLPRLWLELLAVIGLAVLVVSMLQQGKPVEALVPTLGLFAAAAFRLMPSLNKVLQSVQNLRYNLPVIDTLYAEKHLFEDAPGDGDAGNGSAAGAMRFERGMALEHVSYSYPDATGEVLVDVSLDIPRGASVGFIGSSGAGKSTLMNIILGLLTPSSGRVLVDGNDVRNSLRAWQKTIGYVPQNVFLVDDSLRRNVAFGLPDDQIDELALKRAINAAQLAPFVASLPAGLDTMVGERGVRLSGGQCQRIGIARALYHDPPVLMLDEASSALDNATEEAVMSAVNALRGSKTVLIIAHRLSTIARCDSVYEVSNGHVSKTAGAAPSNPLHLDKR